eukprot:81624_1
MYRMSFAARQFDWALLIDWFFDLVFWIDVARNVLPDRRLFRATLPSLSHSVSANIKRQDSRLAQWMFSVRSHSNVLVCVIGTFPLDFIFGFTPQPAWDIIFFLRINRILHIMFLSRYYRAMIPKSRQSTSNPASARITRDLIRMFVGIYMMACFWYLLATRIYTPERTWIRDVSVDGRSIDFSVNDPPVQKLLVCLYWSSATVLTIGYGDITPQNVFEILATLALIIFGFLHMSDIVGCLIPIVSNNFSVTTAFQSKMAIVQKYTSLCKSADVREDAQKYIRNMWNRQMCLDEEKLLQDNLPRHLLMDVKEHICLKVLRQLTFLKGCPIGFLRGLCTRMTPQTFCPGDIILHQGQLNSTLFVKVKGAVEFMEGSRVVSRSDTPCAVAHYSFLLKTNCFASVRVSMDNYCDIFTLERTEFEALMKFYPSLRISKSET